MATCTCSNCFSEDVCKYNDGVNLYCKGFCPHFTPKSDYIKRKRGEWVSVKDRLPEKAIDYLCRCVIKDNFDYPFFMVLRYILVDKNPHFQHECDDGLKVTHWIVIPEPPKGE